MRLAYPTSRAYEFHGVDSPRPHQYECLNNLTTDLVSMAQPIQPMLSPSGKEHHRALLQLFFELMLHIDFYRFFSSMLSLIKPSFCFPQKNLSPGRKNSFRSEAVGRKVRLPLHFQRFQPETRVPGRYLDLQ